jgi:hypothetical protein
LNEFLLQMNLIIVDRLNCYKNMQNLIYFHSNYIYVCFYIINCGQVLYLNKVFYYVHGIYFLKTIWIKNNTAVIHVLLTACENNWAPSMVLHFKKAVTVLLLADFHQLLHLPYYHHTVVAYQLCVVLSLAAARTFPWWNNFIYNNV